MYYVYILKSNNWSKTYVGHTDNIDRRFAEHNRGKSTFTRKFAPWSILYTEKYDNLDEAVRREKYFKSGAGRRKISEIIHNCRIV